MLVEFLSYNPATHNPGKRVLIDSSAITSVVEYPESCTINIQWREFGIHVAHTFDEVKKRLGLSISPRAETIMKP